MNGKVAIPVNENEMLESHFGQTRLFAVYQVEDDKITAKELLTPPPHAPGVLPKWINENGVSELLASTMGERAKKILDHFNVNVHLGTPALPADELMEKYLAGKLEFDGQLCAHHHHDHEHEHEHHHEHHHHNHEDHNHNH